MEENKSADTRISKSKKIAINVVVLDGDSADKQFKFKKNFRVGRETDCEVRLSGSMISRYHVEIVFEEGRWILRDLNSSNGTFIGDEKITGKEIDDKITVRLGVDGPSLQFSPVEEETGKQGDSSGLSSMTQYIKHYFSEDKDTRIGQRTLMIRQAFQQIQKKQKSRYLYIIGSIILISLAVAIFAFVQYKKASRDQELAQNIFYTMKSLELKMAELEYAAEMNRDTKTLEQIKAYREQQKELAQSYNKFLDELHIYDKDDISPEDRQILKIAKIFGECEVGVPKSFIAEVKKYIKKWKSSHRLENAINRALQSNYNQITAKIMLQYHLPPHFFYLALQESDFLPKRIGPKTRYGIAKGYWQFIPETARRFGLATGPLVEYARYDPYDERFNFTKSTHAAAKYIRYIYNSDAQASSLLVFASYNWGEGNVLKLIRQMPENPRERNFWQLLKKYKGQIPRETYDYVFYIIAAAVIGEDPQLFGFNFPKPLSGIEIDENS